MRFRDKVFEDDWEKKEIEVQKFSFLILFHHIFGIAAIALILLQSALSLNIYVFTIWMIIGIVVLLFDITRGNNLTLNGELIFSFFFIFGTGLSILLGDFTSMFFPHFLGSIEILLFQIFTGICLVLRFTTSLYFIEFKSHEGFYVIPTSPYSQEQLNHYQDNLILTDFERKKTNEDRLIKKWAFLLQRMLWPVVIMLILILFAVGYALIIYFIIPDNSIAEFIVRPSLIVVAVLYTILLLRTHTILPKITDKKDEQKEDDVTFNDIEEIESDMELEIQDSSVS